MTGESVRRWKNVKKRLAFRRISQDGDDEGCLHLDRLPTAHEADLIRGANVICHRKHWRRWNVPEILLASPLTAKH